MAYHRAQKVAELGQSPTVIMFNKVLRQYTSSRGEVAGKVPSRTMHQWMTGWWKRNLRRRGWPPNLRDERYTYNWAEIQAEAIQQLNYESANCSRMSWGHLLVDEGQDFPQEMYLALGIILKQLEDKGAPTQLTVFADDNQRLQADRNSRITDIRKFLFLQGSNNRNFVLRKNYRNTRPIAEFCARFQVGNESGIADLPDSDGQLPQVYFAEQDSQILDMILRKVKASPGKQIGVIVSGKKRQVRRAFNMLTNRTGTGPKDPKIQMYLSGVEDHDADQLDFETGNTITVLHPNSAKGLEFDIVFFLGLERMNVATSGFHNERMMLYVMCSRARSELYLAFAGINPSEQFPASVALLPKPSQKLCRYVGLGQLDEFIPRLEQHLEDQSELDGEGAFET